jgi:hypothetical protein
MERTSEKYEQLIIEEDNLLHQIDTCEECLQEIFDFIFNKGSTLHKIILEKLLTSIQVIRNDLQTDLLYTRLNKSVLANQMKQSKDTNLSSGMWRDD